MTDDAVVQLRTDGVTIQRLTALERRVRRLEWIVVSMEGGSMVLAIALRLIGGV